MPRSFREHLFLFHSIIAKKKKKYDQQQVLALVRSLPKAELHMHLTGSYPLSYLATLVTDANSAEEFRKLVAGIREIKNGVSYHESFKYFSHVEKLVNTCDKVENGVAALGKELFADGVVYAEIRMGLKQLDKGMEEYLRAVLRGVERRPIGLKLKLILSIRRDTPLSIVTQTIDLAIKYKDQGVVGIDISGDSTLGQTYDLVPEIMRAKEAGLFLALHVGESMEEIDTPAKALAQAHALELLEPDRLGHAVYLSSQTIKWVLDHPSVPVEVCPTSSVLAGMISHHLQHPVVQYYLRHKHPMVGGSDDPLLFETTLSEEYCKLMDFDGVSMSEVIEMIRMSFDFAFLPHTEKLELHAQFLEHSRKATATNPRLRSLL